MDKTPQTKASPDKAEKTPGKFARAVIRFQALGTMFAAAVTPLMTAAVIKRGKLPGKLGGMAIDSNSKRAAIGTLGALSTAYNAMSGISRFHVASDAAIQEKITQGELPADTPQRSKKSDIVFTRANAAIGVVTGLIAVAPAVKNSLLKPVEAPLRRDALLYTATVAAITGALTVSKWRAANNAQKMLDEQNTASQPVSHAERVAESRTQPVPLER